jgi:ribonuclease J
MTSLTMFGGVNEIGGNKFLVESEKTRVFLDFGQSFSLLDDYFVDWLKPRDRFGLRDYFALGLMPKLPGLYRKSELEDTNLKYSEPECDAVFISHPHFDHTAHLCYLHPEVQIFMGETTKTILKSAQTTGKSIFFYDEDVPKVKKGEEEPNDVKTFRTGKSISIGDMEITPIHVDHSVPGAYGFLVEGKDARIAYSGDLRSHGNKPGMTSDFTQKAEEFEPDALIIEGTRVSASEKRKNYTELYVKEESEKVVDGTKGLVLAMRYPKDLDRFRTFYELAKKSGRKLVISLKTAHLLSSLKGDEALALPDPLKDENIKIYAREMLKYQSWESKLLEHTVDSDWMAENGNNAIWELDFLQLTELIDVQPKLAACIHSMSEPFEEDPMSQLQDEVLHNWLDRFGMPHHQLHASGHASKEEIFGIIDRVKPKKLLPVHTHGCAFFPTHVEMKKEGKIEI